MTNIENRIENAKKVILGNESLLEALDADAATLVLHWGLKLAGEVAQATDDMDDASAERDLEPRLKALRQFMRSVGNWAAGLYVDSESQLQLQDKLLQQLKIMRGAGASLPAADELGACLLSARGTTQEQSVLKLKELLEKSG
ncbi:MAG: hypothetical protein HS124_05195 [Anaerolineales bacterium]|nr:hypothetical protein [Anaerolineales bacterium]MCL4259857.1 hypothetical protein [Anaerolineales bacterium]